MPRDRPNGGFRGAPRSRPPASTLSPTTERSASTTRRPPGLSASCAAGRRAGGRARLLADRRPHLAAGLRGRRHDRLHRVVEFRMRRVPSHREEEPGRPGPLHLPEVRGRCPRRPERSTYTSGTPARRALYSTNCPSWWKAQEWSVTRWGLRSRTLCRIPPRSSRATADEVRSASVTICFEMMWLTFAACRASLRRRFFSRRFADLVPLACNVRRRSSCRLRCRFRPRPAARYPVDVVAMLAMPRSTPMKPSRRRQSDSSRA
jgi:hypothetical protein